MTLPDGRPLLVLIAVVAVVALLLGVRLASWMRGHDSRARNRVAAAGEVEAERLLERLGYRVVERQARARFTLRVDGEVVEVEVRADLIVSRRGRTFVAEVKTGAVAPDPTYPPTRRQLLEYALVFQASEVLLVDVPGRLVRSISFS